MRRAYEKPAILQTTKIEARAIVCAKGSDQCASQGPVAS